MPFRTACFRQGHGESVNLSQGLHFQAVHMHNMPKFPYRNSDSF